MTVPVQRGASGDDPTVTNLILGAIDDLKEHVVRLEGHLTQRLEGLSQQFVPRAEYEARHSDVRNEITKTDARVDAAVAKIDARIDAEKVERKTLEDKLTAARRYALTTSLAGFVAVVALLALILSNIH